MDTKTIIETAEEHLIHTYNRYQIVLDKGDGVHLYDTDGKEYQDFGCGSPPVAALVSWGVDCFLGGHILAHCVGV